MDHPGATALAEALDALDAAARDAKRAEATARRRAREIRRSMDELRRVCRLYGITVTEAPRRSE